MSPNPLLLSERRNATRLDLDSVKTVKNSKWSWPEGSRGDDLNITQKHTESLRFWILISAFIGLCPIVSVYLSFQKERLGSAGMDWVCQGPCAPANTQKGRTPSSVLEKRWPPVRVCVFMPWGWRLLQHQKGVPKGQIMPHSLFYMKWNTWFNSVLLEAGLADPWCSLRSNPPLMMPAVPAFLTSAAHDRALKAPRGHSPCAIPLASAQKWWQDLATCLSAWLSWKRRKSCTTRALCS